MYKSIQKTLAPLAALVAAASYTPAKANPIVDLNSVSPTYSQPTNVANGSGSIFDLVKVGEDGFGGYSYNVLNNGTNLLDSNALTSFTIPVFGYLGSSISSGWSLGSAVAFDYNGDSINDGSYLTFNANQSFAYLLPGGEALNLSFLTSGNNSYANMNADFNTLGEGTYTGLANLPFNSALVKDTTNPVPDNGSTAKMLGGALALGALAASRKKKSGLENKVQ